jgi:hypothetical protein
VWKPEKYAPTEEVVKDRAWVEGHQEAEELSDMEDEFADNRFMEEHRWEGCAKSDVILRSNLIAWSTKDTTSLWLLKRETEIRELLIIF